MDIFTLKRDSSIDLSIINLVPFGAESKNIVLGT